MKGALVPEPVQTSFGCVGKASMLPHSSSWSVTDKEQKHSYSGGYKE